MNAKALTIWCNAQFPPYAADELRQGVGNHRLLIPDAQQASNLVAGAADPLLAQADIAFGQPDPRQVIELPRLRWVHVNSAGYTRYDTEEVRAALKRRGAVFSNSSMVYDEPCAEHVLAMMLGLARQLPQCMVEQQTTRPWRSAEHRIRCRLLEGQNVLILGFGAIARRLVQLLKPFEMNIVAVRRTITGNETVRTVLLSQLKEELARADHIVNILPANASTEHFLDGDAFGQVKPTAILYNIGRGSTVDQYSLQAALQTGRLAAAYLDVTEPEPLPPDHPLWEIPNCFITPHTAGGHHDEFERLVRHFLDNLRRFEGGEPLLDRVV